MKFKIAGTPYRGTKHECLLYQAKMEQAGILINGFDPVERNRNKNKNRNKNQKKN